MAWIEGHPEDTLCYGTNGLRAKLCKFITAAEADDAIENGLRASGSLLAEGHDDPR